MMTAPQPAYRRLPGRRRRVGILWMAARHSLWLGADHLLQSENRLCSEEYRRFYYQDIQAIVTRRTAHWMVWNIVFGVLCGGGVLLSLLTAEVPGQIIGASLAGLGLLLILANCLYGPTCACHLHTAVQTVALTSLSRRRHVQGALDLLQPLIMQAQGTFTPSPEVLAASQGATLAGAGPQTTPITVPLPKAPPVRPFRSGRHALLFALLFCDGVATLLALLDDSFVALLLTWVTLMGAAMVAIMALIAQQHNDCPKGLRVLTWGAVLYVGLFFAARSILVFVFILQSPELFVGSTFWELVKLQADQSPHQQPFMYMTSLISLLCSLGLSALGGISLARIRRGRAEPPLRQQAPIAAAAEE